MTLLAESTTSAIYCAEAISEPGTAPEDIGLKATRALLTEVEKGGCVDQKHQILVLLMMVLGSEDVGRCRMGEPTPKTYIVFFYFIENNLIFFFAEFNSYETSEHSLRHLSRLSLRISLIQTAHSYCTPVTEQDMSMLIARWHNQPQLLHFHSRRMILLQQSSIGKRADSRTAPARLRPASFESNAAPLPTLSGATPPKISTVNSLKLPPRPYVLLRIPDYMTCTSVY